MEKRYRLIIKNKEGCIVYTEEIKGENGNKAIQKFLLKNGILLQDGDSLDIEEI